MNRFGSRHLPDRKTFILPGFKTTAEGIHAPDAMVFQQSRRTGARLLIGSSTVGNHPGIRLDLSESLIHILQGNVDRTGDMADLVGSWIADVNKDSLFLIKSCFGVCQANPRDFRVSAFVIESRLVFHPAGQRAVA